MSTERPKSEELFAKATKHMVGGVNSPIRSFQQLDMTPLIAKRGKEDLIIDEDGNEYIDYCMSYGPLILGHAPQNVVTDTIEQVKSGSSFGNTCLLEIELAELIKSHMSSIEKIRFVSSGTEATMTAIRIARGYTNKKIVIKFSGNYHGHSDGFLAESGSASFYLNTEASSSGILDEVVSNTLSLPFNDIEAIEKVFSESDIQKDIAAVIVEPIPANMGLINPNPKFLETLRTLTSEFGSLLIFDEVISGFRVGLGGAQELYQIKPDLTCLGKIIGGGFPVGAIGGRADIMDCLAPIGEVFQAGTLSGNPVAMQAGISTISSLSRDTYQKLQASTDFLVDSIAAKIKDCKYPMSVQSKPGLFTLFFGVSEVNTKSDLKDLDFAMFKKYFHFLFDRGIYIAPSPYEVVFLSTAHSHEHLEKTRDVILNFLDLHVLSSNKPFVSSSL